MALGNSQRRTPGKAYTSGVKFSVSTRIITTHTRRMESNILTRVHLSWVAVHTRPPPPNWLRSRQYASCIHAGGLSCINGQKYCFPVLYKVMDTIHINFHSVTSKKTFLYARSYFCRIKTYEHERRWDKALSSYDMIMSHDRLSASTQTGKKRFVD